MVDSTQGTATTPSRETTALLSSQTPNDRYVPGETHEGTGLVQTSEPQDDNEEPHKFFTRRFWWFSSLGVVALIILQLTFLPRTSLSRDYRRYHGIHLTKSEVKRNFLVFSGIGQTHESVSNEQYIHNWLKNFSSLNSKSPTNLLSDDNVELTNFVESNFKKFGFKTNSYTYSFPELGTPVGSEIVLLDSKNDYVLYNANLLEPNFNTPSFAGYGISGEVSGDYLYVNEGKNEDYQLLKSNGISVEGKIVIVKTHLNSRVSVAEKVLIAQANKAGAFVNYFDFGASNNKENEKDLDKAISRTSVGYGPLEEFTKPKIVSIPISYKSIQPILGTFAHENTKGPFKDWDYYPIKSSDLLKLKVSSSFDQNKPKKVTNIIASIKGIMNDGDIIIGAKRDSFTSSNPLSNHAILFEIMRNYQRLVKLGWKPLRNIKFISWDGSSNGLIGSQLYVNDTKAFESKHNIISYINIDSDCIMGSKFHVDADPFLNHVLRQTSKYIPIPKSSSSYKSFPESENESIIRDMEELVFSKDKFIDSIEDELDEDDDDNDDDDDQENYTTLHRYWKKQNNGSINNILGQQMVDSDSLIFQNYLNVPTVNIRFDNDPKRDSSIYIPNSNYYSLDWLISRDIDKDLLLHGSLIRYIGLLGISLSEHEVVDYKSRTFFKKIRKFYKSFLKENNRILTGWEKKQVDPYLVNKWSIYKDLVKTSPELENVTVSHLIVQLQSLVDECYNNTIATDAYNSHVQDNLIKDYAWYNYYKKLGHYSQFKLANYKLLHWERELKLTKKDFTYLNIDETYFKNIVYGIPEFSSNKNDSYLNQRDSFSTFTGLRLAVQETDVELTIKWLALIYEKIRNVNWLL